MLVGLAFGLAGWVLFDLTQAGREPGDVDGQSVSGWGSSRDSVAEKREEGSPGAYRGGRKGADYATTPSMMKEVLKIERERNHWDKTIWAQEVISHKFGDKIVSFWNRLKSAEDKIAILEKERFGKLRLGKVTRRREVENGVELIRLRRGGRTVTRQEWAKWLAERRAKGYRIEQTEWRHTKFRFRNDKNPYSEIEMTLHVRNDRTAERAIIDGKLRISWRMPADRAESPFPELIEVADLRIARRKGPTPFKKTLDLRLSAGGSQQAFDPLLVQDLNRDGFSDLVLANQNRLLWNEKGKEWRSVLFNQSLSNRFFTAVFDDLDGDGTGDFVYADRKGLKLIRGDQKGRFDGAPVRVWRSPEPLRNPFVITTGDIDQDGDLDIWLPQYEKPYVDGQMPTPYYDANDGFPAYLLINQGNGHLVDRTKEAGLTEKRFRRTYSSSFFDMDRDGDLDLLVVSDFAGVDLYENDGSGSFRDVTEEQVDQPHLFGMAHAFGDFNGDGTGDFFVTGMTSPAAERMEALDLGPKAFPTYQEMRPVMAFGNRIYLRRENGFHQPTFKKQVADTGWSWGTTSLDWDNDSDHDLYVVNGHTSRESTRDYDSRFWRHDIYAGTSETNRALGLYFRSIARTLYGKGYSYGGYEKNRLLSNQNGNGFQEVGYLMGVALGADCRNVVSEDLDNDGKVDLVVRTDQIWPKEEQRLIVYRNKGLNTRRERDKARHWIGVRLPVRSGSGATTGATIRLQTSRGSQVRHVVTGDSYRAQDSRQVHFGLGSQEKVAAIRIRYPGGDETVLKGCEVDRYHSIR